MRWALLFLAGCEWITLPVDTGVYDVDGDGYDSLSDCDDYNSNAFPFNDESCNGTDNNCSGDESDASDAGVYYADLDDDGYGDAGDMVRSCEQPLGYVNIPWDCDDGDDDISPGAPEADCTSPIDHNCDGYPGSWDGDRDGSPACSDCDDNNAAVKPEATEVCNLSDDNCDGAIDEGVGSTWYTDADADGWGDPTTAVTGCARPSTAVANATDCDDGDATAHPDAPEACNARDDDCDGAIDEHDRFGNARWFRDADGDEYGDPDVWEGSCSSLDGYVQDDTDCDDAVASTHPDADESCDGIDEDCDGTVDDSPVGAPAWYNDSDRDGYGNSGSVEYACSAPARHVSNADDCDDGDRTRSPAATEACDLEDDDCDGEIDEAGATGSSTWYPDLDGDTFGDDAAAIAACTQPVGTIETGGDCDDTDPSFYPGALEIDCADPTDYNCDGSVGNADADGDNWPACEDCDDAAADRNPDAAEVCDDRDDNCDGEVDNDAVDADLWYTDADGDGYGYGEAEPACDAPAAASTVGGDCDDADAAISPAATELCSTADDDNCDGELNVGGSGCTDWHSDADADGYGGDDALCLCVAEDPYVTADSSDCDDADVDVNPDAVEVCGSGVDDNCDDAAPDCGVAGERSLSDADATVFGTDAFGSAAIYGSGALYVSAPADAGAVYRFDDPLTAVELSDASASWTGVLDDELGFALALVDLDGDGTPSLALGAPWEDTGGASAGAVFVFDDPTTASTRSSADSVAYGAAAADFSGFALTALGDQLAVGAYRESTVSGTAGAVYVLSGPLATTATLDASAGFVYGDAAGDFFGRSVAGGDLDADGIVDLVVGAYGDDTAGSAAGAAWFYAGPIDAPLTTAEATAGRTGELRGDNAGFNVAAGADINGDGIDDAAIGAFNNDSGGSNSGAVYLVFGPAAGVESLGGDATLVGEVANDNVGTTITLGDLDADGFADVAMTGDGLTHGSSGAVWVVYGPVSGRVELADAQAVLLGVDVGDYAGDALLVIPDLDADGFDELLVGAVSVDTLDTNGGATYILRGGPGL
jgi:hypothetical protein